MSHREWETLDDYAQNVQWYYWKFLLLDCSLRGVNPPIVSELPKVQLQDFIRDASGRVVDPFWRWERVINTCRDADTELYYRNDQTHFDLGAGQTSFCIPRARRSKQGKTLLNKGNARHNFDSHWLQLGKVIKWQSRPSEQKKQKSLNARAYHVGIERDLQTGLALMQSAREGTFPF